MSSNKFEVIRNEEEHRNNGCHKELKMLYEYYRGVGCTKREAIRYAKFQYHNIVKQDPSAIERLVGYSQLPEDWYVRGKDARRKASERPVDLPPTSVEHPADILIKKEKKEDD